MGHLEGNFTPVLYIWDARFLKVNVAALTLLFCLHFLLSDTTTMLLERFYIKLEFFQIYCFVLRDFITSLFESVHGGYCGI